MSGGLSLFDKIEPITADQRIMVPTKWKYNSLYAFSTLQRADALLIRDGYHDLFSLRLTNAVVCNQKSFLLPCAHHRDPKPKRKTKQRRP